MAKKLKTESLPIQELRYERKRIVDTISGWKRVLRRKKRVRWAPTKKMARIRIKTLQAHKSSFESAIKILLLHNG